MNLSPLAAMKLGAIAMLLGACATGPRSPSDANTSYHLRGVSVQHPVGDWRVAANTPSTLILRKPTQAGAGSFVMGVTAVTAPHLDLRSPEGQRRAVEDMLIAGEAARYRISELSLLPQRRAGAECVTYDAVVEERANPDSGPPLILTNHGFVCRHPDSLSYHVAGAYSERRSPQQKPLLDAHLRGVATEFLNSVRFTSL